MLDWRATLLPAGWGQSGVVDPTTTGLGCEGFVPRAQSLGNKNFRSIKSKNFINFGVPPDLDIDAHEMAASTCWNVLKSTLRYDTIPVVPPCSVGWLTAEVTRILWFLEGQVPIVKLEDVEVVPDSASGFAFGRMGMKTKGSALSGGWDYIQRFWDEAHKIDYPVLWTQAGKVELLPAAKIDAGNIRTFTIAPFEFFMSKASMCQPFNERLTAFDTRQATPFCPGMSLTGAGWVNLMKSLNLDLVVEGDCTKWDARFQPYLFEVCKRVRYFAWDKKGMSSEEWDQRMDYYYKQTVNSYLLMPSGQVLSKRLGNPSGDVNTTYDNCIAHLAVLCFAWFSCTGKSLTDCLGKDVILYLYADDHILSINKKFSLFSDFTVREQLYQQCGILLSKEKDFVSDSALGHTFLGFKAKEVGDLLVPVYDRTRALCALLKREKDYTLEDEIERASSIALLTCFDNETFRYVNRYVAYLITLLGRPYPVRDRGACLRIWLSKE